MWHWHGDADGFGWGGGDWISMALMMILVWGPILLLGYFLIRAAVGARPDAPTSGDSAEQEARRAYARGDIDRERFQQVMSDLRDHAAHPR